MLIEYIPFGNEGDVPHFHVVKNNLIYCRIKYETNEYVDEGAHNNKLDSKECERLNKKLKETAEYNGETVTKWKLGVLLWFDNNKNSKCKLSDFTKQPDYSIIREDSKGQPNRRKLKEELINERTFLENERAGYFPSDQRYLDLTEEIDKVNSQISLL